MSDEIELLPLAAGENATSMAASAAKKAEGFQQRFEAAVAQAEVDVDKALALIPAEMIDRQRRRADMIAAKRREAHRAITSDPEFIKLRQEEAVLREKVALAAGTYGDPLRLAELETVDDSRRAHYATVVKGAGHAGLRSLALKAKSEKNLPLAVAAAQECANLPKNQRPFDPGELVRSVIPPKLLDRAGMFRTALLELDKVTLAVDQIAPTREPSAQRGRNMIAIGLRQQAAQEPSSGNLRPPPTTPTEKIARGLETAPRKGDAQP